MKITIRFIFCKLLPWLSAVAVCARLMVVPCRANLSAFELCSPKNGGHFVVNKPLLFWQSSVGADDYRVFLDNIEVARIPAAPIPVMSYPVAKSLSLGSHHWFIRAESGIWGDLTSSNFLFTIDPSTPWPAWAIGPFLRYAGNPILRPGGQRWENWNVFNPGVIFDAGKFLMLYRGQEKHLDGSRQETLSRIGYAESLDGVTFLQDSVPVIDATKPYETRWGAEDPRLIKYKGAYYTFYTGNPAKELGRICLCEAISTNCINWKKLGIIETGAKNGAIVRDPFGAPVKIDGKFAMYIGDSSLGVCYSDDLMSWGPITWIDPNFPAGWASPYEPCVALANYSTNPDNILLFIAGKLNGRRKWYYAISEMLFSKSNLTNKVDQLNDCIMKPMESYESGTFPNCIWMNSIILHDGQWWMHYGAGDRNIALATAPANEK
jgi:beta-1,2-mannosidase